MLNLDNALAISVERSVNHNDLAFLAGHARSCKNILELGSYRGRTARAMLDNSDAILWCVDSWKGTEAGLHPGDVNFTELDLHIFLRNLKDVKHRVVILNMFTRQAIHILKVFSFDMIFIDADHTYPLIQHDIRTYAPLVSPGGLLCGHDYTKYYPGVVRAVNEIFTNPAKGADALWWVRQEEGWRV